MNFQTLFLVILFCVKGHGSVIKRQEQLDPAYHIDWEVDIAAQKIDFVATVATTGYVGFGISYTGGMRDADIVIGGVYANGSSYFGDYHGVGWVVPVLDNSQDWHLASATQNASHTVLQFSRVLDSCDSADDILIGEDTLKIIWSIGSTDDLFQHATRGVLHVNFLDPPSLEVDLSSYSTWDLAQPLIIPGNNDTTYWCTFFKSPVSALKHHMIGFDVFKNGSAAENHTHHVDFLRCKPPAGVTADEHFARHLGNGYNCYYPSDGDDPPISDCSLFELQWSIGGKVTVFPDNLGLPFGELDEAEYFMTEVHYDNPNQTENLEIHSGLRVYYTEDLRPIDAGFIFVGPWSSKTYSLTIPPESEEFVVASHCVPECTSYLPPDGINIFVYLLHAHLAGRKQRVRHFRDGVELPWLANDEHYDFNYQTNRMLRDEVKLLPGDQLTLECTYETNWRENDSLATSLVTVGGRSPREEMCQTFLMYYPRQMEVNQCGSYFPQLEMLHYMGISNVSSEDGVIDPTVLLPLNLAGRKYTDVVENLNWTENKRKAFQDLIRYGPQQGYCDPMRSEDEFIMTHYPTSYVEYIPKQVCVKELPDNKPGGAITRSFNLLLINLSFCVYIFNFL